MATLIRRASGTYDSVPGFTQPNAVTSIGGSSTSGDTFGGLATNQYSFWNASNMPNPPTAYDKRYQVTAPSLDYATFEKEYYIDSRMYGMLGTGYGAAARYAASPDGFRELYGSNTTGTNRLALDYDYINKASEVGSMANARQSYNNMSRLYDEGLPAVDYKTRFTSSPTERWNGSSWVDPFAFRTKSEEKIGAGMPLDIGWNVPNQLFGYKDTTVGRNERYAPTSISGGRGLHTGAVYSLSGQYNTALTDQLMQQVNSRWR